MSPPTGGAAIPMRYSGPGQADRLSAGATSYQEGALGVSWQARGGARTHFTYDPEGELLSMRTPTADYYYLEDGEGSVVALTDAGGTVVDSYDYDPFGEEIAELEPVDNPFEYLGEYEDEETEFIASQGYYDPATAALTQSSAPSDLGGVGNSTSGAFCDITEDIPVTVAVKVSETQKILVARGEVKCTIDVPYLTIQSCIMRKYGSFFARWGILRCGKVTSGVGGISWKASARVGCDRGTHSYSLETRVNVVWPSARRGFYRQHGKTVKIAC